MPLGFADAIFRGREVTSGNTSAVCRLKCNEQRLCIFVSVHLSVDMLCVHFYEFGMKV